MFKIENFVEVVNDLLDPFRNKNVDIQMKYNGMVISTIHSKQFDYEVDNLFLSLNNDCSDCQFDIRMFVQSITNINEEKDNYFKTIHIATLNNIDVSVTLIRV